MQNKILQGDALTKLKELPEKSVNMCMTSPPYWALRDYGVDGQLGLEPTFDQYISTLCDIFDEVKRVLRDDGTCWVNIGDTYWGGGQGGNDSPGKQVIPSSSYGHKAKGKNYQSKSLVMIPQRFALEMINRGWILRNTIIWHKPNAMPSSVKDRFTVDFEYLFFFSKKKKYYFETQYEPHKQNSINRYSSKTPMSAMRKTKIPKEDAESMGSPRARYHRQAYGNPEMKPNPQGRNKRTVWSICPKPFKEAHFAVYPEELCETPIKAGCPKGGVVLDPFFGAGTTGLVALKQNKKFIGIELNPEYIKIAEKRLNPLLHQRILHLIQSLTQHCRGNPSS